MLDHPVQGCIHSPTVTALCIWEAVLFQLSVNSDLAELKRTVGSEVFRHTFAQPGLIRACEVGYSIASNTGFRGRFDDDWCPMFVEQLLQVDPEKISVKLRPDWLRRTWDIGHG